MKDLFMGIYLRHHIHHWFDKVIVLDVSLSIELTARRHNGQDRLEFAPRRIELSVEREDTVVAVEHLQTKLHFKDKVS